MSVDYTAYAIIGVKLDKAKCYQTITHEGCSCIGITANAGKWKFCPECGKPVARAEKQLMPALAAIADNQNDDHDGPTIIASTYDERLKEPRELYFAVAWCKSSASKPGFVGVVSSYAQLEIAAKAFLEPLGLWELNPQKRQFGVHCVLVVDC